MKILLVFIIVLSSIIGMSIIGVIGNQLRTKYSSLKKWLKWMPLFGLIFSFIILFWAVHYLFQNRLYYNVIIISIIIVLSLIIGWFLLKDIFAGIIFRIQNNYAQGEYVQFGAISGRLHELQLTHISLNTQDGKAIRIPYSRLGNEIISVKLETKSYENNRFELSVKSKYTKNEAEERILTILNNTPWRLGNSLPLVNFVKEDKDWYTFEIHVQVRNQKHLNHIKDSLSKRFL